MGIENDKNWTIVSVLEKYLPAIFIFNELINTLVLDYSFASFYLHLTPKSLRVKGLLEFTLISGQYKMSIFLPVNRKTLIKYNNNCKPKSARRINGLGLSCVIF